MELLLLKINNINCNNKSQNFMQNKSSNVNREQPLKYILNKKENSNLDCLPPARNLPRGGGLQLTSPEGARGEGGSSTNFT